MSSPAAPATTVVCPATGGSGPNPAAIMQVGMGFMASRTLLAAVEFGVFTELAARPSQTRKELEAALGLHARSSRDFLDGLVALGFLQRCDDKAKEEDGGRYSNAPDADFFLDKKKPTYIGGIMEMCGSRLFGFWNDLPKALRTGLPQNEASKAGGQDLFTALYADPERLKGFLSAMTGVSMGANRGIAASPALDWARYKTFCDAGTAQGDLAVAVAQAHPHMKGFGADLAACRPIFEEYAARMGVSDRVQFASVDFFKEPLPKVDVVLMGHILHDWGLDKKRALCRAAYAALSEGGAFVVYDLLIDDERRKNVPGLMMSLNMLIESPDGFDYTAADGTAWLKEAGFKSVTHHALPGPDSFLLAIK